MKKNIFILLLSIVCSCNAQSIQLIDMSRNEEDSKVTPENFSEGDEFLQSYMISVTPDGDYYTNSKLYKIEGLCNPKILEIKETTFPKFLIKVEHGLFNDRKTKLFELEGVE